MLGNCRQAFLRTVTSISSFRPKSCFRNEIEDKDLVVSADGVAKDTAAIQTDIDKATSLALRRLAPGG